MTDIAFHVAIQFVFAALAVALAITDPVFGDAPRVLASVFLVRALMIGITNVSAVLFILARVAILFLVATPPRRDAAAVVTLKFVGSAAYRFFRAVFFVRPIAAIIIAVASESLQDTSPTRSAHASEHSLALKLAFGTVWQREVAVHLIAAIFAVSFPVTLEGQRYTCIV